MTNNQPDPWDGLSGHIPEGQIHARRADPSHPHDFFWAVDARGHRLLVYRAECLAVERKTPSLRGVNIELTSEALTLRLQERGELEIFLTLCRSLLERTRSVRKGVDTLDCIFSHLERWQRFLGKPATRMLSDEEIWGLFCELKFLEKELIPRFGEDSVGYWLGPAGNPQDFSVGTTLFEVKSHQAGSSPVVTISSAEQLWHENCELFLTVYTIGTASKSTPDSSTLRQLVLGIREQLHTEAAVEAFESRLMEVGYIDHPDYDQVSFLVGIPDFYLVSEDFPHIGKSMIANGICRLKYGIELPACRKFRASPDWNSLGAVNAD